MVRVLLWVYHTRKPLNGTNRALAPRTKKVVKRGEKMKPIDPMGKIRVVNTWLLRSVPIMTHFKQLFVF